MIIVCRAKNSRKCKSYAFLLLLFCETQTLIKETSVRCQLVTVDSLPSESFVGVLASPQTSVTRAEKLILYLLQFVGS